MNAELHAAPKRAVQSPGFREFDLVRLVEDVESSDGFYPKDSVGTVVYVYDGFQAFEVEFARPQPGVVTLKQDQLASA